MNQDLCGLFSLSPQSASDCFLRWQQSCQQLWPAFFDKQILPLVWCQTQHRTYTVPSLTETNSKTVHSLQMVDKHGQREAILFFKNLSENMLLHDAHCKMRFEEKSTFLFLISYKLHTLSVLARWTVQIAKSIVQRLNVWNLSLWFSISTAFSSDSLLSSIHVGL